MPNLRKITHPCAMDSPSGFRTQEIMASSSPQAPWSVHSGKDPDYERVMTINRKLYEDCLARTKKAFADLHSSAQPILDLDYDTFDTNKEPPVDIFEFVELKRDEISRQPGATPMSVPQDYTSSKTIGDIVSQVPMLLLPTGDGKLKMIHPTSVVESNFEHLLSSETLEQLQYLKDFIESVCAKSVKKTGSA